MSNPSQAAVPQVDVPPPHAELDASSQLIMCFAEMVADSLALDSDARDELRDFVTLLLNRGTMYSTVFQQATALHQVALQRAMLKKMERMEAIVIHLKAAALHKTDLEDCQRAEMGLICRRVTWDPKRYDFDNTSLANAAWAILEENKAFNNFYQYFTEPRSATLEKNADSAMSERCSSAKNTLRLTIISHAASDGGTSLTKATRIAAKRLGGILDHTKITADDVIRMALFRHFFRLNEEQLTPKTSKEKKRKHSDMDTDEDGGAGEDNDAQDGKKGAPPPPGADFWTLLLNPLHAKLKELGSEQGETYKQFINSLMEHERKLFKDDKLPLIPLVERRFATSSSAWSSSSARTSLTSFAQGPATSTSGGGIQGSLQTVLQPPLQQNTLAPASRGAAPRQVNDLLNPIQGLSTSTAFGAGPSAVSSSATPLRFQRDEYAAASASGAAAMMGGEGGFDRRFNQFPATFGAPSDQQYEQSQWVSGQQ
ncbi:hypothetical protein EV121DRAFT_296699 [Schizophyllum commune]